MPPKKELCKYFQRGSCHFGQRCKFLHTTPQQSNTNPFGFGAQASNPSQHTNQQQQVPNPFGFGMQNRNQSRGGNDFGSRPNQNKPFENTWSRSSLVNTGGASVSRQSEKQQPASDHKCTDSESCKRIIAEDFQNEKPLWKLTCYGHNRNGPCDVVGDISCEELRALAYDDAKNRTSFQLTIDRERSLLNSKLVEFQNLLQKPYPISSVTTPSNQNPFAGVGANATTINSGFSSVTSPSNQNPFAGVGANATTINSGFSSVTTPSNQNPFAGVGANATTINSGFSSVTNPTNQNPFAGVHANAATINSGFSPPASNFSQLHASLSKGSSAAVPNYSFGQANAFQNNSQPSTMFQTNNSPPLNTSGSFASQFPQQPGQGSVSFGSASAHRNPFSTFANTSQTGNVFDKQLNFASNEPYSAPSIGIQLKNNTRTENTNVDDSIWKKAEWKWNAGEIPEDAPPDIYIH